MIFKRTFLVLCLMCASFFGTAQMQERGDLWQIGIGASVVKFADEDASYIGDRFMFQIPRLNLTIPVSKTISLDGALSFNTFDVGFITNSAKYVSFDGSIRYNFKDVVKDLEPYLFIGGSIVGSERKTTPTMNVGTGLTYWVSNTIGLNTQIYYKHSLESYESMRSHIQVSGALIFTFDGLFGGMNRRKSLTGGACFHNPND